MTRRGINASSGASKNGKSNCRRTCWIRIDGGAMKLDSKFVGTKLKEYSSKIEWRETTNYAAAISDNNPFYFDDERDDGIVAPPMFAEGLAWRISGKIREYIEAEDFPAEVLMTQVHYSEHISFHRPIVPGDELTLRGEVAAILPHRAGTHAVIRYDAADKRGQPVFTKHTGSMMRGVECTGGGRGEESLPEVPAPPDDHDGPAWTLKIEIDPMLPYVYDGCADIVFAIHTSPRFAKSVGLPGIILQGTATLALAAREILNREADGDPRRLKEIACRFSGMVAPGTEITMNLDAAAESAGGKDLFFTVENAEGKHAIRKGYARIE
ncbi:MaoC/PaaZ C-terminal domain-containing protein [bacterium]